MALVVELQQFVVAAGVVSLVLISGFSTVALHNLLGSSEKTAGIN